jgi:hypothetical protein
MNEAEPQSSNQWDRILTVDSIAIEAAGNVVFFAPAYEEIWISELF